MMIVRCILCAFAALRLACGSAEQIIANCNETALIEAVQKGGSIRFDCDGIISLSQPLLIVTNLLLDATGRSVVLDGRGSNRIFDIAGARVAFTGLIFSNGAALGEPTMVTANSIKRPTEGLGGALKVENSEVSLLRCTFAGNQAMGGVGGGVIWMGGPHDFRADAPGQRGVGGAIFSEGSKFVIEDCRFVTNRATGGVGGGYFANMWIPWITPSGDGYGGAIYATNSELTISRSTFEGCLAGALDG